MKEQSIEWLKSKSKKLGEEYREVKYEMDNCAIFSTIMHELRLREIEKEQDIIEYLIKKL